MHHDCQLYYAPDLSETYHSTDVTKDPQTWMTPMTALKPSSIVTVPANWHLDDWPPMQLNLKSPSTHGFVDPHVVERLWKEQFDFYYREYDSFVFPISIHPDVSGKPHVILVRITARLLLSAPLLRTDVTVARATN